MLTYTLYFNDVCIFLFFTKKANLFHESYWPSVRWYKKMLFINLKNPDLSV